MELSAIWVVVIVLIGIAIGVYSICKGCQGLREQSAQALASLQERSSLGNNGQQNGEGSGGNSNLYHISGSNVLDKNPPKYEEIMEPPPSYEETIKLHPPAITNETSVAQINYGFTHTESDETQSQLPTISSNDSSSSSTRTTTALPISHSTSLPSMTEASSSTSCSVTLEL
ncbi:hypothetical protein CHUAL_005024 [Chamberlinius hualienensis]